MFRLRHQAFMLTVVLLSCGDDLPNGVLGSTSVDTNNSTSTSDDGADETADGTTDNPVADGAPCNFEEEIGTYEFDEENPPGEYTVTLNGDLDCDYDGILGTEIGLGLNDEFEVWIYHPQDALGNWPVGHPPFPAIFMAPGRGLELQAPPSPGYAEHRYLPVLAALAREGFVVIGSRPREQFMDV